MVASKVMVDVDFFLFFHVSFFSFMCNLNHYGDLRRTERTRITEYFNVHVDVVIHKTKSYL